MMENNPSLVPLPSGMHLYWKVRANSLYKDWIGMAIALFEYPILFADDDDYEGPETGFFLQLGFKNGVKLQFEPSIELTAVPYEKFIEEPIRPK